jgi:hypothetical protein
MPSCAAFSSQKNTKRGDSMGIKNSLTNEKLRERFENSFQLVNHAISIARDKIHRGEEFDSNPTEEILESIIDNQEPTDFEEEEEDQ